MKEAGRLMWPDKYDVKAGKLLSAGKLFVTQFGDILWQLDGHHEKLAAQQSAEKENREERKKNHMV